MALASYLPRFWEIPRIPVGMTSCSLIAASELKDGIIHYDASVSCERIFKTQHQDQETTNQNSIGGNLQRIANALKSSLDCIAKTILSLNDAKIHSSALGFESEVTTEDKNI